MSYYNRKIIKKSDSVHTDETVHINENFIISGEEEYIAQTFQMKKEQIDKELNEYKQKMMEQIHLEMERMKQKGYLEGKEKAKEEAMKILREEMETKLSEDYEKEMEKARSKYYQANHYAIEEEKRIREKRNRWIQENEEQIVAIIMSAVKKVIGNEIESDAEDVKNILQESLNEVNDKSKKVWVRLHPESKEKLEEMNFEEENVEFLADPTLDLLDVLVETENEWVDSTLRNKLQKIEEILSNWVVENEPIRGISEED